MKKTSVISAVLLLLTLAQVGQAADLQAGWYAKISGVQVYVPGTSGFPDYGNPQLLTDGYFYSTPPGQYGPFQVDGGTPQRDYRRNVSVLANAYGVGSVESLVIPLWTGLAIGDRIAFLEVAWATNYDSSQMRLQLWRTAFGGADELVWAQSLSGQRGGSDGVAYDTVVGGAYYFKVDVVPEPSSIACLAAALASTFAAMKRRI